MELKALQSHHRQLTQSVPFRSRIRSGGKRAGFSLYRSGWARCQHEVDEVLVECEEDDCVEEEDIRSEVMQAVPRHQRRRHSPSVDVDSRRAQREADNDLNEENRHPSASSRKYHGRDAPGDSNEQQDNCPDPPEESEGTAFSTRRQTLDPPEECDSDSVRQRRQESADFRKESRAKSEEAHPRIRRSTKESDCIAPTEANTISVVDESIICSQEQQEAAVCEKEDRHAEKSKESSLSHTFPNTSTNVTQSGPKEEDGPIEFRALSAKYNEDAASVATNTTATTRASRKRSRREHTLSLWEEATLEETGMELKSMPIPWVVEPLNPVPSVMSSRWSVSTLSLASNTTKSFGHGIEAPPAKDKNEGSLFCMNRDNARTLAITHTIDMKYVGGDTFQLGSPKAILHDQSKSSPTPRCDHDPVDFGVVQSQNDKREREGPPKDTPFQYHPQQFDRVTFSDVYGTVVGTDEDDAYNDTRTFPISSRYIYDGPFDGNCCLNQNNNNPKQNVSDRLEYQVKLSRSSFHDKQVCDGISSYEECNGATGSGTVPSRRLREEFNNDAKAREAYNKDERKKTVVTSSSQRSSLLCQAESDRKTERKVADEEERRREARLSERRRRRLVTKQLLGSLGPSSDASNLAEGSSNLRDQVISGNGKVRSPKTDAHSLLEGGVELESDLDSTLSKSSAAPSHSRNDELSDLQLAFLFGDTLRATQELNGQEGVAHCFSSTALGDEEVIEMRGLSPKRNRHASEQKSKGTMSSPRPPPPPLPPASPLMTPDQHHRSAFADARRRPNSAQHQRQASWTGVGHSSSFDQVDHRRPQHSTVRYDDEGNVVPPSNSDDGGDGEVTASRAFDVRAVAAIAAASPLLPPPKPRQPGQSRRTRQAQPSSRPLPVGRASSLGPRVGGSTARNPRAMSHNRLNSTAAARAVTPPPATAPPTVPRDASDNHSHASESRGNRSVGGRSVGSARGPGGVASVGSGTSRKSAPVDLDSGSFVDAEEHVEGMTANASEHAKNGEFTEALEIFGQIMRSHVERFGAVHGMVASTHHNVGIVHVRHAEALEAKGDLDGRDAARGAALRAFQAAARVARDSLGQDHPNVAVSLVRVGFLLLSMNQPQNAVVAFRESLRIRRSAFGDSHPLVAKVYTNLGVVHLKGNGDGRPQHSDAKRAFEASLEVHRSVVEKLYSDPVGPVTASGREELGRARLEVAEALCNVANVCLDWIERGDAYGLFGKRRADEAESSFAEALAIRTAILGPTHTLTLQTRDMHDKARKVSEVGGVAAIPPPTPTAASGPRAESPGPGRSLARSTGPVDADDVSLSDDEREGMNGGHEPPSAPASIPANSKAGSVMEEGPPRSLASGIDDHAPNTPPASSIRLDSDRPQTPRSAIHFEGGGDEEEYGGELTIGHSAAASAIAASTAAGSRIPVPPLSPGRAAQSSIWVSPHFIPRHASLQSRGKSLSDHSLSASNSPVKNNRQGCSVPPTVASSVSSSASSSCGESSGGGGSLKKLLALAPCVSIPHRPLDTSSDLGNVYEGEEGVLLSLSDAGVLNLSPARSWDADDTRGGILMEEEAENVGDAGNGNSIRSRGVFRRKMIIVRPLETDVSEDKRMTGSASDGSSPSRPAQVSDDESMERGSPNSRETRESSPIDDDEDDEAFGVEDDAAREERLLRDPEKHMNELHRNAAKYIKLSQFARALYLLDGVLQAHRRHYGDLHPLVGQALHKLGIVYLRADRLEDALDSFQRAIQVRQVALGPDHPDVASSLVKLGIVRLLRREFREALATFRDSLSIRRHVIGHLHPLTARVYTHIGAVHLELNEMREARRALDAALDVQRAAMAVSAEDLQLMFSTSLTLCNMGCVHRLRNSHTKAIATLREALVLQEKVLGRVHPTVLSTLESLADAFAKSGDACEALKCLESILKRFWETEAEVAKSGGAALHRLQRKRESAAAAVVLYKMSRIYKKQNDAEAAVGKLEGALEVLEASGGGNKRPNSTLEALRKRLQAEIELLRDDMTKEEDMEWV